jgi:hypothetical protein
MSGRSARECVEPASRDSSVTVRAEGAAGYGKVASQPAPAQSSRPW